MRHKYLSHPLCALAYAALTLTVAQAAELGDITPRSYIGQPLAADIELTSLTPEEVNGLQVRLAIPDVYRGANVTMNPALSTVRMAVVRSGQKQYLHVTTTRAVDADYVHLYVELGVPGKQDVRLATIWLQHDPNPPPPPPVAPPPTPAVPLAAQMTSAQAAQIAAQAKADRAAKAAGAGTAVASPAAAGTAPASSAASAATHAAAEPAAIAAARERNKPAPLPSPVETETGRSGSSKASTAQALAAVVPEGPPRRIAGVLVSPSGKPIKPSLKDDSADVPVPLNVAQALLPLAPLPLPKGVKRPAPMSCPPGGMTAKECVALDKHNEELSSKITELEGKLKALQGVVSGAAAPSPRGGSAPAATGGSSTPRGAAASATSAPPSRSAAPVGAMNAGAAVAQGAATAVARADAAGAHAAVPATAARGDAAGAGGAALITRARADGVRGAAAASAGAANGSAAQSAVKDGDTGRQASGAKSASADGAVGGKPDPHSAKDSVASTSMSAKGDVEMRAAQARAGASASDQAAASAAASEAASAPVVPTKKIRVLPKLKYKKEKPAEQSNDYTLPLAAGGIGVLALLGAGYIYLRKKNAGKGPLKIWQGFRKRKEPVLDDAPSAQDAPASMAEQ